jgi:putative DNA methylase
LGLDAGGTGATAYADAVAVYLAFVISKVANAGSATTRWFPGRDSIHSTFARQALPMSWDFAEINALGDQTGGFLESLKWTVESLDCAVSEGTLGVITL